MARACQGWGFFQVVNHGLDDSLRSRFEVQMRDFFALPAPTKRLIKRAGGNARGWYDDEYTKQRRDWKLTRAAQPARVVVEATLNGEPLPAVPVAEVGRNGTAD